MTVTFALPVELWNIVFSTATSTPGVLDTSPLERPFDEPRSWTVDIEAVDWDAKYSLPLVSRKWHRIAGPYLYEHIRIMNKRRLPQLATTLRNPIDGNAGSPIAFGSNHIGLYVKRIDVCVKLADYEWTKHYIQSLSTVCNLCTNLSIFHQDYHPQHPFPSIPRNIRDIATIRDLQLSCRSLGDTLKSFHVLSTIEVLILSVDHDGPTLDPRTLPQLHTLIIHCHGMLSWLTSCSLPKLTKFSAAIPRTPDVIDKFLQKHGHGINDLDVVIYYIHNFAAVFRHCPSLERLSLHTRYLLPDGVNQFLQSEVVVAHQALERITVFSREGDVYWRQSLTSWKDSALVFLIHYIRLSNFPNLTSIRFDIQSTFSNYLRSSKLDGPSKEWMDHLHTGGVRIEGPSGVRLYPTQD